MAHFNANYLLEIIDETLFGVDFHDFHRNLSCDTEFELEVSRIFPFPLIIFLKLRYGMPLGSTVVHRVVVSKSKMDVDTFWARFVIFMKFKRFPADMLLYHQRWWCWVSLP